MIATEPRTSARRSRSLAQLERDAALGRVGRVRRGLIIGAAALTAGFAALVSAIAPGRSAGHTKITRTSTRASPRVTAAVTKMPPLASAGALGLQGPSQPPQTSGSDGAGAGPAAPAQSQSAAPQSSAPSQSVPSPGAVAPAPTPAPAVSGGS
jgi:hypothetical protein